MGQVRPTRMPQGLGSSGHHFHELGYIAFGAIPEPNPEPNLIGKSFRVYVDDMFMKHNGFWDQFLFIRDHWLPRLAWARLRLSWKKLYIFMNQMGCLGVECYLDGSQRIRPSRTNKILEWPTPTNASDVRKFMGAVQICKRWIRNFTEISRPITRLGGKADWRWTMAEEVSFRIIKNKCAIVVEMFSVDESRPLDAYFDASGFGLGFALLQRDKEEVMRPLLYDALSLLKAEKNYGTYKRELLAMVMFGEKYHYYF